MRRLRPATAVQFGAGVVTTGSRAASVSDPGLLCKLGFNYVECVISRIDTSSECDFTVACRLAKKQKQKGKRQ